MMRKFALLVLVGLLSFTAGCSLLDGFYGVEERVNPETGEKEIVQKDGPSPAESLGVMLAPLVPWAGAVLGIGSSLYQSARKKKYAKAGKALVPAIDMVLSKLDRGDNFSRDEVVDMLVEWKRRLDVEKEINELRGK